MGLGLGSTITKKPYKAAYAVTRSVLLDGTDEHITINNSVPP
tara:strand:+ start:371 stop:496 length:126 start_codon:yes stop_codon:yes gene_type:complete